MTPHVANRVLMNTTKVKRKKMDVKLFSLFLIQFMKKKQTFIPFLYKFAVI